MTVRPPTPLAMQFASEGEADRLNLRALLSLFRRRLLMIATIIGICTLLALLITQNQPKLYTANTDIVIKPSTDSITPGTNDAPDTQPQASGQIDTEVQLIQSLGFAETVFDKLGLAKDAEFAGQISQPGRIGGWLQALGLRSTPPADTANMRQAAAATLAGNVTVKRIGNSFALRIGMTNPDPELAAKLANGYAQIYSDSQVAGKVAETQNAIAILGKRMEELRLQAQTDFGAVQNYRIGNGLQTKSGTALTEQEISAYNQQVALARAEATQDAARLSAARSDGGMGTSTTSPVVNALRGQRAALSVRVAELSERYLPSYPDLVVAREQLADIDRQINEEVSRAVESLAANAQASSARLGSLERSLGGASGKLDTNNRALINLDDLERKAAASQALYESYLNRYKEVVARAGAEQANSSLLTAATVPLRPSSPNLPLNLSLGLLVGLLLGTGSAIAVEGAYAGLTTPEDVESRLLARCLGPVPLIKSIEPHADTPLQTIADYPGGAFTESVRSVLAATRQSTNSRNQVIAVTSALPGEGKTSLAACLARTAAMAQERVAIIDCDVVRRNLSLSLGGSALGLGLQELFAGPAAIDAVPPCEKLGGATLFAILQPFPSGARLLDSGKLHRLIAQLREKFDLIILDCAPILPIAETREIVALADNVIIVTRWRNTADRVVRSALKKLPLHVISDLGVVLNAVDMRKRIRFGDGYPEIFSKNYQTYYASAS